MRLPTFRGIMARRFRRLSLAARLGTLVTGCVLVLGVQATPALAGSGPPNPQPASQGSAAQPPLTETQVWCERQLAGGNTTSAQYISLCGSGGGVGGTPQSLPGGGGNGCLGASCNNQDPVAYGCTYNQQLLQTAYGGTVYNVDSGYSETDLGIYWSNFCQANWTVTWTTDAIAGDLNAEILYSTSCGWYGYYSNSCHPGYVYNGGGYGYSSTQYSDIYTSMLDGASGTPCTGSMDYADADNMDYLTSCWS